MTRMIEASCHCGAVLLAVEAAPAELNECRCSVCRRYGVLWAYYPLRAVRLVRGDTVAYVWGDRTIEFHRCRTCGCVSHWAAMDETVDRMGVNARLLPPEVLAGACIKRSDGPGSEG